jgi:hypothetical protein
MRLLALALAIAAPAVAQPAPPGPPPVRQPEVQSNAPLPSVPADGPAGWMEKWDELWKKRDQPATVKELRQLLDQQLTVDSRSFEASWRLASLLNWEADGGEGDRKADLGKQAWEAGDKAILAKPGDVRGHYQAGTGIGLYSEGVGILTALSQGLEGKFRERIQTALKIDKDYLDGAPQVVWGRYFFKLPWPKRDVDKSVEVLMEAVRTHPDNLRAKLYLADSLNDSGKGDEAKRFAQDVIDSRVTKDPAEEKRVKELARKWLSSH